MRFPDQARDQALLLKFCIGKTIRSIVMDGRRAHIEFTDGSYAGLISEQPVGLLEVRYESPREPAPDA